MKTQYDEQAAAFLKKHGLKVRITLSDTKAASWEPSGHHYRVTVSRDNPVISMTSYSRAVTRPTRLVFDFWGSAHDMQTGQAPSEYDILTCISSDAYCPETFEDFCAEYGYEADSIKALQTFRRADRFAKRLRAFFTESELSELGEIQ